MKASLKVLALLFIFTVGMQATLPQLGAATSLMEKLNRGVVAVRASSTDVFASWRLLGTETTDVAFNLYRSTGGAAAVLLNATPLAAGTNYTDTPNDFTQTNAYYVCPVIGGVEQTGSETYTLAANASVQPYLRIPLQIPAGSTTLDGVAYTYSANDCSVGDLDGDGEYEIIVKWDPSNSKDNSQSGYTGNVYLDAYKLNGTLLWRIDLGINIRAGAHYTQFMVYDLDGDGKAEIACRTAEGSKDASGAYVAASAKFTGTLPTTLDHTADRRNLSGYILGGAEFLTIFDGLTGVEKTSTNYNPPRYPGTLFPTTDQINAVWGDNYGNRIDRFLACVAYLDGRRPSLVMCRGYYTRTVLVAYDYRDGKLTQRWIFDTNPDAGAATIWAAYRGQGNHNLTVADVNGDGRDEIVYGSCTIASDGRGLYSTQLGHGDALHVTDMDPNRPGLEIWVAHEDFATNGGLGHTYRDAATGAVIFSVPSTSDAGRAMAGCLDSTRVGYELWGARGNFYDINGTSITTSKPSMNFGVWWDGDLQRELLDGTTISKWNPATNSATAVLSPTGIASNNSTKSTPNLSADILGDWREEVVWRESDSSALRIYTTTTPASYRLPTLMHDRQYRESIAWQNIAYNQPPYTSYYLGTGMTMPPQPDIVTTMANLPALTPAATSINRYDPATSSTGATSVIFRVTFNTPVTGVDTTDFTLTSTGTVTGTITTVTAQSPLLYDVAIGSITGTGTIRLDLKASGTGIIDANSVPLSGSFTSGENFNRATLAWTNTVSGGLWSNSANWDGGVIANGLGAIPVFGNFDLAANNTVVLDSARTLSGLTFGDTDTTSAASWIIRNNSIDTNVLTLDITSGTPTLTVGALGTGATATIDTILAGTVGLTKAGAGTLVLTKPNTLSGALTVTTGNLQLGPNSALSTTAVTVNSGGGILSINGGALTTTGTTIVTGGTNAGQLLVNSGTANLGVLQNTNTDGALIKVTGGSLTATRITLQRGTYTTTPSYATGFITTGGSTTIIGAIGLGTNNSSSSMSVEGGTVTVDGTITIGNQTTGGRGGAFRVTSGTFTSTDTTNGIVLSKTNGTNANNVSSATFSGGTSTVEKITFGYDATVTAGSGTLTLSGGELYLGSGGLIMNGITAYTAAVNLTGGMLGSKADWSTSLPIVLTNNPTIKAANAANSAFAITLNGVLSGAGGFTKTGPGTLTLTAPNTFTGDLTINDGSVSLTGSLASGGIVSVNSSGILAGNGTSAKAIVLASNGTLAPGLNGVGTLSGTSLTWNGGARYSANLGASSSSDLLALSGALTKGTAGTYEIALITDSNFAAGNTYTLATFASTTFVASDFTATGLPTGYTANFTVNATSLQTTIAVIPPTITSATNIGGTIGQAFSFGITATNTPTSYSATGLPDGLTLNTVTGVIIGTPTTPGTYTITLSATNAGGTTNVTATLTVTENAALVTLFGTAGTAGNTNATGTAARFNNPNALAVDSSGVIYVADTANHLVRKIALDNAVTTLAGSGTAGSADATGTAASFSSPSAILADASGNLYLADTGNNSVRKIVIATGVVSTVATGFNAPAGLALDNSNLYVANSAGHTISKIVLSGPTVTTLAGSGTVGSTNATGIAASFNTPNGLTTDTSGNLYVADTGNGSVRKVVLSTGVVSTYSGGFTAPKGLIMDAAGRIHIIGTGDHTIHKVISPLPAGSKHPLVGLPGVSGSADGLGTTARLNSAAGMALDPTGDIYIADTANHTVRILQVSPEFITPQIETGITTVPAGSNVTYARTATGSPTPTYQWNKDGIAINSATQSSLVLTNVQTTDSGTYSVTATNLMGSATWSALPLTVTPSSSSSSSSSSGSSGGGSGGGGANAPWVLLATSILFGLRRLRSLASKHKR